MKKIPLAPQVVLFCLGVILYFPTIYFPFLNFDDPSFVSRNRYVMGGLTWPNIAWAFSLRSTFWHPLTWLSHMADVRLYGLDPAGHHLSNILLHSLNAVLLYVLLKQATKTLWPSVVVAALFLVHPMNVESVAWIAERKNVLSTLFLFLTLGAYGCYVKRAGRRWYCATLALFAFGLAAKSMLVTVPLLLLIVDFWPLQRLQLRNTSSAGSKNLSLKFLVAEKVPFLLFAAIASWLTIKTQAALGATHQIDHYSLLERFAGAIVSYSRYIGKMIAPVHLSVMYPYAGPPSAIAVIASLLLLLLISLFVIRSRTPYLIAGWLWFLVALLPVIGVVQVGYATMADRYAYVPFLGLFAAIVFGIDNWTRNNHDARTAAVWATAIVIVALAVMTRHQLQFWKSDFALWSHAVEVVPQNYPAEIKLGEMLDAQGKSDEALAMYRAALGAPGIQSIHFYNIGTLLQQHNLYAEAVVCYRNAISRTDFQDILSDSYNNLGMAEIHLGNYADARQDFTHAIAINSELPEPYAGLSNLAVIGGKYNEAVSLAQHSIELQPTAWAYVHLGDAYRQEGRKTDSITAYRSALKLAPDLDQAKLGIVALNAAQ